MGNAPFQQRIVETLESHRGKNDMLDIHIEWALDKNNYSSYPALTAQEGNSKISTKKHRLICIVEKGLPRDA